MKNLVGKEVFWLGNVFIVTIDQQRSGLVESLEHELDFCGVHSGPAAMYGNVTKMDAKGNLTVRFLSAAGSEQGESCDPKYNFYIPKGMYVVVSWGK